MDLRPELQAPAIDEDRVSALTAEIDRIQTLIDLEEPADGAVAAFNAATGHDYPLDLFASDTGMSNREWAIAATRPAFPRVPGISRAELAEVVRRIQRSDDDTRWYLLVLEVNVVHPAPADVIFWPPPELAGAGVEDIVDAILRYRPIAL